MRTFLLLTLALMLPLPLLSHSQLTPRQTPPTFSSHEIHPDHTVTFRCKDTTAAEVKLVLEGTLHPVPMHRTADGIWTLTSAPLPPELYTYSFQVDGKNHADPDNPRSAADFNSVSSVLQLNPLLTASTLLTEPGSSWV